MFVVVDNATVTLPSISPFQRVERQRAGGSISAGTLLSSCTRSWSFASERIDAFA